MQSGNQFGLLEFMKIGLLHNPSGRLLTSESFRGSLNVSGVSLKRKQIWTLFTDPKHSTAFLLQNHLGNFLSADKDGNVCLISDKPGPDERFVMHFSLSGVAIQSEAYGLFLHWSGTEMRCFSKEAVLWGLRLAIHPQIHLRSVHRNCLIRSAHKESELRAVMKMPCSPKFILWLEQLPLNSGRSASTVNCGSAEIARLSRVALRTESGSYLCADGSLKANIEDGTLFSVGFKPDSPQTLTFQDERGEYLTVGPTGVLRVKSAGRGIPKEGIFSITTPSTHVHLWAFSNKFACTKQGLTFSASTEEAVEQKFIAFQLEYVGGLGAPDLGTIFSAAAAAAATDATPAIFSLDSPENTARQISTGLWRLRSQDGRLWQIPKTGVAKLAPKDCDSNTTFEVLYVPSYDGGGGSTAEKESAAGGIVLRTPEGFTVCTKTLGTIGASEQMVDGDWRPRPTEVLHMITLVNRTSIACYSPLAGAFMTPVSGRRGSVGVAERTVECTSSNAEQWFLRRSIFGTIQLYTKQEEGSWFVLTVTDQNKVVLLPSETAPYDENVSKTNTAGVEFVLCMVSDKHVLLRRVTSLIVEGNQLPGFLCTSLQGGIRVEDSGTLTAGCIWQI